jgi:hypothetical protein
MKKIILVPLTLLTLLLAISCSSIISKDDCKKDMKLLGLDHGKRGLPNLSEELRRVCLTSSETVSLEAYQTGFNMGWSNFCTPFQGFEMGKKGDLYKSFCPPEKEDLFHEKFLIGKNVYEKKDQVSDIEEKIKELKATAEKDSASQASKDDLKRTEDYVLSLKREIQALEQKGMSLIHTN